MSLLPRGPDCGKSWAVFSHQPWPARSFILKRKLPSGRSHCVLDPSVLHGAQQDSGLLSLPFPHPLRREGKAVRFPGAAWRQGDSFRRLSWLHLVNWREKTAALCWCLCEGFWLSDVSQVAGLIYCVLNLPEPRIPWGDVARGTLAGVGGTHTKSLLG